VFNTAPVSNTGSNTGHTGVGTFRDVGAGPKVFEHATHSSIVAWQPTLMPSKFDAFQLFSSSSTE
jgi:hypothetical protein